jgi:hypothetical protein
VKPQLWGQLSERLSPAQRRFGALLLALSVVIGACSPQQTEALGEQLGYYDLFARFQVAPMPLRIIYGILGVALLVAGYRVFYSMIAVTGALVGAGIGLALASQFAPDNTLAQIIGLLIGGILGALLARVLFDAAIFIMGVGLGAALADRLWIPLMHTATPVVVVIIGGIIGGLGLLGLSYVFVVLVAALLGAMLLALVLNLGVQWVVIFFIAGVIIQYAVAAARRENAFVRGRRSRLTS